MKPVDRQSTHLLERAGLFEEMGSAGYDRELALAAKLSLGLAVELEHLTVGPADDQQRRRSHRAQVPGGAGSSGVRARGPSTPGVCGGGSPYRASSAATSSSVVGRKSSYQ